MKVLFFHPNYPGQFGPIAHALARSGQNQVRFVATTGPASIPQIQRINYKPGGGATASTHYCSRTFENTIWHSHAVFNAMKAVPDFQPDLIVGHSGFGSTLFLRELYRCPIINYFEYFYRTTGSDLDFRPEHPVAEIDRLRARARNATILLDLENCDVGYCPTQFQHDRFPAMFHDKLRTIFDGVDVDFWKPQPRTPRQAGQFVVPENVKVVTYVARGLESMRGFDIFMRFAKRLYQRCADVYFIVVGEDRICYGGDEKRTGSKSFKQWVLSQDNYDLSRFAFLGAIPPEVLARLFSITDLHVYLTVPFVLSWSLFNALACGTTVLASDTAPVREIVTHEVNGLLVDFFDVEKMADSAERVLREPAQFQPLGVAGRQLVSERYSTEVCLPRLLQLFEQTMHKAV